MQVTKIPIELRFRVATATETLQTLEGPITVDCGYAILTGTKGEVWGMPWPAFEQRYGYDLQKGTCTAIPVIVQAEQQDSPFSVKVSWSDQLLHGAPGDWLLTYGKDDYGVVAADIFARTYQPAP